MKKILAVLLMLALIIPFGMVVNATEDIETDPFYFVNISSGIPEDLDYVYHMPFFYTPVPEKGGTPTVYYDGHPAPAGSGYGSYDIEWIALALKETFDNTPEGARYINFQMPQKVYYPLSDSLVYIEEATAGIRNWLSAFLAEYSRIGGKLDGILIDVEYEWIESYYIYKRSYMGNGDPNAEFINKNIYKDIVNDPRYLTEIRPMLEERGFKFWENPTGDQSELWSMHYNITENNAEYAHCDDIWDAVMQTRMAASLNEAVYEPTMKYYPDAIVSDYQSPTRLSWLKQLSDYGGVHGYNSPHIGNATNFSSYNNRINNGVFGTEDSPTYSNIIGYNKAVFGSEPFTMTMWETNMFKKMHQAVDYDLINAYIVGYNTKYGQDRTCSTINTPYYTESLFHMGLMDMKPFIGYIVPSDEGSDEQYQSSLQVVSDIMVELTRVAGASDRKVIPTPASFNGGYVLSGMYAGGRNIWRITPNTEIVSLEDFKVSDKAPTFSIDGQTIVFPQGRIIEDGEISVIGSCGYWVETPADVMPVITSVENRYELFPAYEETFEQYEAGTTLTSDTALPKAVWDVTGTAKIQANGDNKVLVLNGSASVSNVKLPQNVTAGDSYAKQQAWEVTFTLPSSLRSYASLTLLSCGDTGIKISNGKLYYDQSGSSKELTGLTMSAGTYTVKREVDFRTEGAYTCTYSIYDSNGVLLKEVKNVPMKSISLPVTSIKMSCLLVNNDILIDNYKIYPTGVTTDFSLYDAEFGMQLTDLTQVRTKDTAYRVSWMNTTNETKIAYVYNVQNGVTIDRVEMLPGQDGVITGVVEASASSPIQLAVRTEDGVTVTPPSYDDGDFNWPKWPGNTLSGNVISSGDAEDIITLELLRGTTVVKTKLIPGNGGAYEFTGLQDGTYTLKATQSSQCQACSNTYTVDVSADAVKDVTIQGYSVTHTAPDCVTAGNNRYTCAICGHSYTETIPATGHTEATREENMVVPTLTSAGSYDLVSYCSVCGEELGRETIELAALRQAKFTFPSAPNAMGDPITIQEGDAPIYLKTVVSGSGYVVTEEGTSEDDYQIKITFELGGKPTITLNGATVSTGDPASVSAIIIGDATASSSVNNLDVDVVIAQNSTLQHWTGWGGPAIKSYINGDLTITSNGGSLTMRSKAKGTHGVIDAVGNVNLTDANISISYNGNASHYTNYITTASGDITVSGGSLTVSTHSVTATGLTVLSAPNGTVTIQDNAEVNITVNCNATAISAANGIVLKDSIVNISGQSGKLFSQKPTIAYSAECTITTDAGEYAEDSWNTYSTIKIKPYVVPKAQFTFASDVVVTIAQGDAPIYLKTGLSGEKAYWATLGGDETDYNIKVSFPEGGKPTITLNGATLAVNELVSPIVIGDVTASNIVNDVDVDIVVVKNSSLGHYTTWGQALIKSYINGTLTITSNGGDLGLSSMAHKSHGGKQGLIYAVGDIKLLNANVAMSFAWDSNHSTNFIHSTTGDITISGGKLTATTKGGTEHTDKSVLLAPNGTVTIENFATVQLTVLNDSTAITAGEQIVFKDSVVSIIAESGTLFSQTPTIDYASEYFQTNEAGVYSITPIGAKVHVTFNQGSSNEIACELKAGDAPVYFKTVNGVVVLGGNEADYNIKLVFPAGGKPQLILNGAVINMRDDNANGILIGKNADAMLYHSAELEIVVKADSAILATEKYSGSAIKSYNTGALTIVGDGGMLEIDSRMFKAGGAISSVGDVNLLNAKILMYSGWDGERGEFIRSENCDIVISGGWVEIKTNGRSAETDASRLVHAPYGSITIENSARVTVFSNRAVPVFYVGEDGNITIKDSTVSVGTDNANATLFNKQPVISFTGTYQTAVSTGLASANTGDATDFGGNRVSVKQPATVTEYSASAWNTYKYFSIIPPAKYANISLYNGSGYIDVTIFEGGAPQYFKTVDGVVTAEGASAEDYNIKITYAVGDNPTIYLKNAGITTYGDGRDDYAIIIGSATASDACNDLSVDIVVEGNSEMKSTKTWSAPYIQSYITGTLTITSKGGALNLYPMMNRAEAAINVVGDILLKDANMTISSPWSGQDRGNYIRSTAGNIIIDGGNLTVVTNSDESSTATARGVLFTEAVGKGIIIRNGAQVNITLNYAGKAFYTKGNVTIKDSVVNVTSTGSGTVFVAAGLVLDYVNDHTATGDGQAYDAAKLATYKSFTVEPHTHEFANATCTEPAKCSCGLTQGVANGHTEVVQDAGAATCTTPGLSKGIYCSVCGEVLLEQEVIPALGHTEGQAVAENNVAADCTNPGSYDVVVYCSVCGEELSRETITVDAAGHSYNTVVTAPTCTEPGYTTYTCANCGDNYVGDNVAALGHTSGSAVVENLVKPSGSTLGSYDRVIYCSNCGIEMSRTTHTVEKLGQARFVFADATTISGSAGGLEILINEGDAPIYLKVSGGYATEGGSASDYQIKITYHIGENPKLYLKGANLKIYGDARGLYAITIGSATASDACNGESVDVIIEETTTNISSLKAYADAGIMSYITGTLTISSVNDGVLDFTSSYGIQSSNQGWITASGDILLKNANINVGAGASGKMRRAYIYTTGNLTVDGGSLTINTNSGAGGLGVLCAKNITICNGAEVDITLNSEGIAIFNAASVTFKDATVKLAMYAAGSHIFDAAPMIEGYANCYILNVYNGENVEEYEIQPATGHTSADAVIENETATSYDSVVYCSVCGEELSRETIITACAHQAGEAVKENEVAADCDTAGSYDLVVYCTACGEEMSRETVTVDALGHTDGEAVVENEVAADCTNPGSYDNVTYCSVCGEETGRETVEVPALGHTDGEAVVENEVAADCTNPGSYDNVTYCSVCGEETGRETVEVPALGHTAGEAVVENATAASCGAAGSYDEVVYCSVCDEELSRETKTVEALPHTSGDPVVENNVAPNCSDSGSYDNVTYCSVCGEELSRETTVVPALGHTYDRVITAPGCTTGGYTTYTCSVCGDNYVADEIAALGHTAGEKVIENEVDATCAAAGSYDEVVYCSVCGEELSRETIVTSESTEHTPGEAVEENVVKPTYDSTGSYDMVVYCTVCGEELSRESFETPKKEGAVAEVNGVKYSTLIDAIAHANGSEIKLLKNASGDPLVINGNTTINFAGFTYTVNTPVAGTKVAVKVSEGATLTLKGNGKLVTRAVNKALFESVVLNNGTLVVDGIIVSGDYLRAADVEAYYTVKNTENAVVNINSGIITPTGRSNGYAVNMVGTIIKGADVDMDLTKEYCWVNGTTAAPHSYTSTSVVGATATTNGYVKHECACGDWYASDFYTSNRCVATVGEYYFRTLQEAIDNANGGTVTLLKNVSGDALIINGNVTIDLAGYTYTVNTPVADTNAAVVVAEGATLTLTGDGKLAARYSNKALFDTLILNEGTLNLDGVELNGSNLDKGTTSYVVLNNGVVNGESNVVANNSGVANGIFAA